jgi:hypothetical protein
VGRNYFRAEYCGDKTFHAALTPALLTHALALNINRKSIHVTILEVDWPLLYVTRHKNRIAELCNVQKRTGRYDVITSTLCNAGWHRLLQ